MCHPHQDLDLGILSWWVDLTLFFNFCSGYGKSFIPSAVTVSKDFIHAGFKVVQRIGYFLVWFEWINVGHLRKTTAVQHCQKYKLLLLNIAVTQNLIGLENDCVIQYLLLDIDCSSCRISGLFSVVMADLYNILTIYFDAMMQNVQKFSVTAPMHCLELR